MADDDMELSSDNGQVVADDDIDIDIDLTAGQNDEDHVLDDVRSEVGLEDIFDRNAHGTAEDDHLMADDENTSFPMDDDNMLEDTLNDFQAEDAHIADLTEDSMADAVQEIHPDENEAVALETVNSAPLEAEQADTVTIDVTGEPDPPNLPETGMQHEAIAMTEEISGSSNTSALKAATSPSASSTQVKSAPEESSPKTNSTSLNASGVEPLTATGDKTVTLEDRETDQTKGEETVTLYDINKVVVVYQDSEYSLVSSTESDDPDSFFFQDDSLTKSPLSEFISGLRLILHDDIPHDDEICLLVEDLGLEINEASAASCAVTFAQIFDLHQSLAQNDGVEIPPPLYLSVIIRPDFTKRFRSLVSEAAEGKGLSSLLALDEQSDSYAEDDDSGEADQTFETTLTGNTTTARTAELVDQTEQSIEQNEVVIIQGPDQDNSQSSTEINNGGGQRSDHAAENHEHIGSAPLEEDTSNTEELDLNESATVPQPIAHHNQTTDGNGDVNEEFDQGDLIDYEEEEYEQSNKANIQNPKLIPDGRNNGNVEYEAKNEDLRRSSLSGAAEEPDTGNFDEPQFEGAVDKVETQEALYQDEYLPAEANPEAGGEDFYDNGEDEDEPIENGDVESHLEDSEKASDNLEPQNPGYESYQINAADVFSTVEARSTDLPLNTEKGDHVDFDGQRHEDADDFDYEVQLPEINEDPYTANGENVDGSESYLEEDEIGYEEEAGPATEPTGSETTLIGDEVNLVQEPEDDANGHDEIDYDDEEEHKDSADSVALDKMSPTSSGQNGKRTRSDVEEDETLELTSNAKPKRVRS